MNNYKVIKSRKSSYDNPIKLQKDDVVVCGEEYNEYKNWDGWIWCTKGVSGWVPKQIINRDGTKGIITEDYDATELDVKLDDIIVGIKALNGWIWGHKKDSGLLGWVPYDNLEDLG